MPKLAPAKDGWSFVIITNGREPLINSLAQSIEREMNGEDYEVIVVGPPSFRFDFQPAFPCKLVPFEDEAGQAGWITRKKNLGVFLSQYDKCVVTHDYLELDPGFLEGFEKTDKNWIVGTTKVFFSDGRRSRDWITADFPTVGQALLPYELEYSQYQYLNGSFFFVRRDFYLENPLDERRRWGQAEDIEWSFRIRQKTKFTLNSHSSVHFNREKPDDEAPYSASWRRSTQRLFQMLGKQMSE